MATESLSRIGAIVAYAPEKWQRIVESLSAMEAAALHYDWESWRRPSQRPPDVFVNGEKATWFIQAGRGFGKTRVGAEQVITWARDLGRDYGRGHIALVGKDPADTRDVMIENQESGILACSPPWFRPIWEPTKRKLTWPNRVSATTYSSETPDDLRGPQHHKAWGDEPAKWKKATETWDQLQFGLRLGEHPQTVLTGTPRPTELILLIIKDHDTVVTRGHTEENKANLSERFIKRIYGKYAGTRLGRQELHAELLKETPGALWTLKSIDAQRVSSAPELAALVLAVDPAVTDPKELARLELEHDVAETGIVVAGRGVDGHLYVLHDFSGYLSPDEWGSRAVTHYDSLQCEKIIGEVNNGGDLVEFVIKTAAEKLDMPYVYKKVHASRGKRTRAEPISALYEQKRGHHVGTFPELEDQMTTWTPGEKSPDRMDALVWAATEVMLNTHGDLLFG